MKGFFCAFFMKLFVLPRRNGTAPPHPLSWVTGRQSRCKTFAQILANYHCTLQKSLRKLNGTNLKINKNSSKLHDSVCYPKRLKVHCSTPGDGFSSESSSEPDPSHGFYPLNKIYFFGGEVHSLLWLMQSTLARVISAIKCKTPLSEWKQVTSLNLIQSS